MKNYIELLEGGIAGSVPRHNIAEAAELIALDIELSSAISLKRIADALEPIGRLASSGERVLVDLGLKELVEQVATEAGMVKGSDGKWSKP